MKLNINFCFLILILEKRKNNREPTKKKIKFFIVSQIKFF